MHIDLHSAKLLRMFLSLPLVHRAPAIITVTQRLIMVQIIIVLGTALTEQNPAAPGPLPLSPLHSSRVLERGQGLLGSCEGHKVPTTEFNPRNTVPTCQVGTLSTGAGHQRTGGLLVSLSWWEDAALA